MRKTWVIRILLLIGYCVPFVFLSVNADATFGTMMLYGVMIASFSLLCLVALKTNNIAILYIGNALSFASSYTFAKLFRLELMEHYFKPFTSHSLILIISIFIIIFYTIIILIYIEKKKQSNSK
ncbi:hypothetical protein SCB17_002828 [Clostridium perfringens]|nr:hypothetical protein [Clostridium perfringens]